MIELTSSEKEGIYGGGFAAVYLAIGVGILAVAAFKIFFAENAKLKLPFGFEISFDKSTKFPWEAGNGTGAPTWNTKSIASGNQSFISNNSNFISTY